MDIRSILSICSGIGGLDLGVHLANARSKTICYVEREAYPAATLVARMEDKTLGEAPIWDDLTTFDGKPWRGKVDCVSAGFPCQPWSVAGKRKGTTDDRWLWADIWKIVRDVRAEYVFLENVPGLLRGGIECVLGTMAQGGYDAEWGCFSAEECGFPHKRERLFILAKSGNANTDRELYRCKSFSPFPDPSGQGLQGPEWEVPLDERRGEKTSIPTSEFHSSYFLPGYANKRHWQGILEREPWVEPAVCRASDGSPGWLVEANEFREDRIRALGNGVVPLVAAYAFKILKWRLAGK